MDQVAVRAVDLADIIACIRRAACGVAERREHGSNIIMVHFERHRKAAPCWQRTWCDATPRRHACTCIALVECPPVLHRTMRSGVATAMTELDCGERTHFLDEVGDAAVGPHL